MGQKVKLASWCKIGCILPVNSHFKIHSSQDSLILVWPEFRCISMSNMHILRLMLYLRLRLGRSLAVPSKMLSSTPHTSWSCLDPLQHQHRHRSCTPPQLQTTKKHHFNPTCCCQFRFAEGQIRTMSKATNTKLMNTEPGGENTQ